MAPATAAYVERLCPSMKHAPVANVDLSGLVPYSRSSTHVISDIDVDCSLEQSILIQLHQ